MMECEKCNKVFTRRDNLRRHQRQSCQRKKMRHNNAGAQHKHLQASTHDTLHDTLTTLRCDICAEDIPSHAYTAHLRCLRHKDRCFVAIDDGIERMVGAFQNRITSFRITSRNFYSDAKMFLAEIKEKVLKLVQTAVEQHRLVKINVEIFGLYHLEAQETSDIKSFNTKNLIVTATTDLFDSYDDFSNEMTTKAEEFQERGSGWVLVQILYLEVNINKYNPTGSSSYIDIPECIKQKKAVINVQNWDQECFGWAITSALRNPTGLAQRISSYPHYTTVADFTGMEFPVKICEIVRFEERNNISINVYGLDTYFDGERVQTQVVGPLHFAKIRRNIHINLLIISDDKGNSHYCWIKNLSRLVSSQTNRHEHSNFICDGCLIAFPSWNKLIRHQRDDCNHIACKLPTTDERTNKYGNNIPQNILMFENFEKQLKVPFVVYADFETILKPIQTTEPNPEKPFTIKCYEHEPYSFAYYVKCSFNDNHSKLETYRGDNAALVFIRRLENDVLKLYQNHLGKVYAMKTLSLDQQRQYAHCWVCHICGRPINDATEKVRDHDHLTGEYRGPAHMNCNINYKIPNFIPVFFHNLTGYDSHLFIKQLARHGETVDVIAQNKEKYVSFTKHIPVGDYVDQTGKRRKIDWKLRFLDSYRFMAASLEKLGSYLNDGQCAEIRKYFPEDEKFVLMRQKGVFPYLYVDSFEKLKDEYLPSREQFYDTLREEEVSQNDYQRAHHVWDTFNCKTLGDYSDIYLASDVLLLADTFENFRTLCLNTYQLDPAQYYTAPGFSWSAMLRVTRIELELLTDIDMLHFFKKGIRGGVSMCTGRKALANNSFLPQYDATSPSTYILYLDATNLYGYSMCQKLPTRNFHWLSEQEIQNFNVLSVADDNEIGYVLEVNLEYPDELHDVHNDLPFCPEAIVPPGSRYTKLIPNLYHKTRYIIHYRNLKQCLENGLRLRTIHRILAFEQLDWMRPYVDLNTRMRNAARNEFEKAHYKAMNNNVFGKTMENVDNRVDIKLSTHWENRHQKIGAEGLIAKPNFKSCTVFTENLAAIHMNILSVTYNKPVYIGFCVLDLSKTVIYEFFYSYLKTKYGNNISLLYTDTDSLIVHIQVDNIYDNIKTDIHRFDTSNYPASNVHGIPRNTSVLGNMKDEYAGVVIRSFYGTGAKAYCVETGTEIMKKAKGVKKYVIEKMLSLTDYKTIVEGDGRIFRKMYIFRSSLHNMYTELKNKVVLSSHDDKRFVIPGTTNTLAWGHYDLRPDPVHNNLNALVNAAREIEFVDPAEANLDILINAARQVVDDKNIETLLAEEL